MAFHSESGSAALVVTGVDVCYVPQGRSNPSQCLNAGLNAGFFEHAPPSGIFPEEPFCKPVKFVRIPCNEPSDTPVSVGTLTVIYAVDQKGAGHVPRDWVAIAWAGCRYHHHCTSRRRLLPFATAGVGIASLVFFSFFLVFAFGARCGICCWLRWAWGMHSLRSIR